MEPQYLSFFGGNRQNKRILTALKTTDQRLLAYKKLAGHPLSKGSLLAHETAVVPPNCARKSPIRQFQKP
jgi:hypothetical protein